MARSSGKYSIKGTRGADDIAVGGNGVTINGRYTALTAAQIDAGLSINGDGGNDRLAGGRGPDDISGGGGNDTLTGGGSLDRLMGGSGDDRLIDHDVIQVDTDRGDKVDPNANLGAIFDGGLGIDTIDFSGSTVGVAVHLGGMVEPTVGIQYVDGVLHVHHYGPLIEGRIADVENLIGSAHDDLLWGSWAANRIEGGQGNDYIVGLLGDDQLLGDGGNDFLAGGDGNDRLTGGSGDDIFAFSGDVASSNDGHDLVLDYTPGQDRLLFDYSSAGPTWQPYSYAGMNDSLIGTYNNGASTVVIVGITDPAQLTVAATADQGMYDVYHFSRPEPDLLV